MGDSPPGGRETESVLYRIAVWNDGTVFETLSHLSLDTTTATATKTSLKK